METGVGVGVGVDVKIDNHVRDGLKIKKMKIVLECHQLSGIYCATDHHVKSVYYN